MNIKINLHTTKGRKEYINAKMRYQLSSITSEIKKLEDFINITPKTLYKFRSFDKYTSDMIENDYAYLAAAETLDDPFDCLTNIDLNGIYNLNSQKLSNETIKRVVDIYIEYFGSSSINKRELNAMVQRCIVNGEIDSDLFFSEIDKISTLNFIQKNILHSFIFSQTIASQKMSESKNIKKLFYQLANSKKEVGVCSFTTKRDNKPMWSLYANNYKGYCLEYEIPKKYITSIKLIPVIYTNKYDNNIINNILTFGLDGLYSSISGNIENLDLSFCVSFLGTKSSDWKFQDEWRIIDESEGRIKPIKIKNIYLGFDVTHENENIILNLSSKKGFGVYKMDKPFNTKKVTYTKLR